MREKVYKSCGFAGHRILGKDFDYNTLDRVILNLVRGGCENFYCGMAMGFDLAAAETVIGLKKDYKIKLIACIPCADQDATYTKSYKERYLRVLDNCDEKVVLSEGYYDGCMFVRDRFIVDNCDVLVCYRRRKKSGTSYTANYAESKGLKLIEL